MISLPTFVCERLVVPGPVPGRIGAGSGPTTCHDGSIMAHRIAICLWLLESQQRRFMLPQLSGQQHLLCRGLSWKPSFSSDVAA